MPIAYRQVISESVATSRAQEQCVRGTAPAPRLQMLPLLTSGEATNLPPAARRAPAALVGHAPRQKHEPISIMHGVVVRREFICFPRRVRLYRGKMNCHHDS